MNMEVKRKVHKMVRFVITILSLVTLILNLLAIKNIHDIFKKDQFNMSWIDRVLDRNFNRL
ncbi:hypothetical protein HMPREF3023_01270 [Peptoniphilus sp. HMSC075B08]|nr:hypothetical protein HMPREF3023_01270 [Peptoniphilus sp. HMSC075B08]